jgi:glycosyltransferase involved in cell wall biosynthesis
MTAQPTLSPARGVDPEHEPIDVAVAFHEPVLGGSAIGFLRVLPLLEAHGCRFTFWTAGDGQLRDELERRGYPVTGESRPLRYSRASLREPPGAIARLSQTPGYLRRFRQWVRRESPTLVHANTLIMIPEALAARTSGVPVFMYVHEILPRGIKGAVAARLIRAGSNGVLVASATSLASLRRQHVRAEMVSYGIELPDPPTRTKPSGPLVVGALGNVSRRKGTDVFVSAVELVRSERPDIEFRLIGPCPDGPDRGWAERVVARARELGVKYGVTQDPFAELSEWDMLVLPTRREPFGLVLIEAMGMRLPVVATRIDGPREVVTEETGVLVDVDDARALADAILELAADPERRERMGACGRARVASTYSLERQAEGVLRAYRETAARARTR